MFAKPINFILIFIVIICNLIILTTPIIASLYPFIKFKTAFLYLATNDNIYQKVEIFLFFLFFIFSFFMIVYIIFDFIFSISAKSSIKNCKDYQKIKDYRFLSDIFKEVQNKFNKKNVKLLIKNSNEINAYAIGGMRQDYIILTHGIINHFLAKSRNINDFLLVTRSIVAHEMSHIVNKDFLPSYLIIINQKVTNLISNVIYIIFSFIIKTIKYFPYIGKILSKIINFIHNKLIIFLTFFNRVAVYNIYEFLRKFISRSIEYRCDKQSSLAFGGNNMSLALSMLGKNSYFTIFSTHPSSKNRIKKIKNIKAINQKIRIDFVNLLSNIVSFLLIIFICYYFADKAKIDLLIKYFFRYLQFFTNIIN